MSITKTWRSEQARRASSCKQITGIALLRCFPGSLSESGKLLRENLRRLLHLARSRRRAPQGADPALAAAERAVRAAGRRRAHRTRAGHLGDVLPAPDGCRCAPLDRL